MGAVAIQRQMGSLPLDVVIRENHNSKLKITSNPIETGSDVTDHAYVEPKELELEAIMAGMAANPAAVAASYQSIIALQATREPFALVTGLMVYKNMLIEEVSVQRDKGNATILFFTARLKEVIIVDTQSSAGDSSEDGKKGNKSSKLSKGSTSKGATSDRASPKVDRGNTSGKSLEVQGPPQPPQSALSKILGVGK